MADSSVYMQGPSGPKKIKIIDNEDGTFSLATNAVVTGDIVLGAVELKDADADDHAKIAAASAIVEADLALAVQAPVLGVTTGTKVITDAAGTLQQYLRGLVTLISGRLSVEHSYTQARVTADGQIKNAAGFIHALTVAGLTATPTAGLLTIYDSLTETGTVLYSEWVPATVVPHTILLDVPFGTGLFVGFDGSLANVQVQVSYR